MSALVPVNQTSIATLEQACKWLSEVKSIEEALSFRDQVEAVRHYRQVSGHAIEACNEAAEIKVRAERRIGELLEKQLNHDGGRPPKNPDRESGFTKLADVGVSYKQSERFQAIASIPEAQFEAHLAERKEAGEQITTAETVRLAKSIKKEEKRFEVANPEKPPRQEAGITTDLHDLIECGEKFSTIYADPPWVYENQRTRGATSDHYGGMSVEEIAGLPVARLVTDNAHLHLWTTNGFIEQSFAIMRAWGFEYKSMFIWAKTQIGMGNYWRVAHEMLLFGVRGSCPFAVHNLRSWAEYPRGQHSAKPEPIRGMIEKASPGPYLELFGRRAVCGWTVFGNQVERDLFTSEESDE